MLVLLWCHVPLAFAIALARGAEWLVPAAC